MTSTTLFGLIAIVSLVPATLLGWRPGFRAGVSFWAVTMVAVAGPVTAAVVRAEAFWRADFASTIWVTIAVTLALFVLMAALVRDAWRLSPLLMVYMLVLSLLALAWQKAPAAPTDSGGHPAWLFLHIGLAVATYGLATLAAVAALAAFIQERALKRKRRPVLEGVLPSITDCDRLVTRFLAFAEAVLGAGVVTGVVLSMMLGDGPLPLDHKTVFTIGAFAVIAVLLFTQIRYGIRGRRAARGVLLAYLLLTLGYPGVKFVTDVLLP